MNYLTSMGHLLSFSTPTPKKLQRLQLYCIVNVLVLGVIYGCSAALFSRTILGVEQTADILKIIVAGIPVAFFMHAGAALFIWVFLRAMGGKSDFMHSYFHIGMAAISLWPLAPFVAVLQTGTSSGPLVLATLGLCAYAFAVNVQVIQRAFRLSALRMTLATAVTLMYISCFLYLWV